MYKFKLYILQIYCIFKISRIRKRIKHMEVIQDQKIQYIYDFIIQFIVTIIIVFNLI